MACAKRGYRALGNCSATVVALLAIVAAFLAVSDAQVLAEASIPINLAGWGANDWAQLANGRRSSYESLGFARMAHPGLGAMPGDILNTPTFTNVSCAAYHCLALTADGTVYGWGSNLNGQLGLGESLALTIKGSSKYARKLATGAKQIAVSDTLSWYLATDGTVFESGNGTSTVFQPRSGAAAVSIACGPSVCLSLSSAYFLSVVGSLRPLGLTPPSVSVGLPWLHVTISDTRIMLTLTNGQQYFIGDNSEYSVSTRIVRTLITQWTSFTQVWPQNPLVMSCGDSTYTYTSATIYGSGPTAFRLAGSAAAYYPIVYTVASGDAILDLSCASGSVFFRTQNAPRHVQVIGNIDVHLYAGQLAASGPTAISMQNVLEGYSVSRLMSPSASAPFMIAVLTANVLSTSYTPDDPNGARFLGFGTNFYGQSLMGRISKGENPVTMYGPPSVGPKIPAGLGISTTFNPNVTLAGGGNWSLIASRGADGNTSVWMAGKIPVDNSFGRAQMTSIYPVPVTLDMVSQPAFNSPIVAISAVADGPVLARQTSATQATLMHFKSTGAQVAMPDVPLPASMSCAATVCYVTLVGDPSTITLYNIPASSSFTTVVNFTYNGVSWISVEAGPDFFVVVAANRTVVLAHHLNANQNHALGCANTDDCIYTFDSTVVQVSSGTAHTLLVLHDPVTTNYRVLAFGNNDYGQLGVPIGTADPVLGAKEVLSGPTAFQVAAVGNTSFALTSGGSLYTWGQITDDGLAGYNALGILQGATLITGANVLLPNSLCLHCVGSTMFMMARQPAIFESPYASGGAIASAPTATARRVSFGANQRGQLGVGSVSSSRVPVASALNWDIASVPSPFGATGNIPAMAFGANEAVWYSADKTQQQHFAYPSTVLAPLSTTQTHASNSTNAYAQSEVFVSDGYSASSVPRPWAPGFYQLQALSYSGDSITALDQTKGLMRFSTFLSTTGSYLTKTNMDTVGFYETLLPAASIPTYSGSSSRLINSGPSTSDLPEPDYAIFMSNGLNPYGNFSSLPPPNANLSHFTFGSSGAMNGYLVHSATGSTSFEYVGSDSMLATCTALLANARFVLQSNDSRFLALVDGGVTSCGYDNTYGVLGYSGAAKSGWNMALEDSTVTQIASIPSTNFALSSHPRAGSVWVWGFNGPFEYFGFSTYPSIESSPTPILIPWTARISANIDSALFGFTTFMQVKAIYTSPTANAVHFFIDTYTAMCQGDPPGPTFVCIGSTWVSEVSVSVPGGSAIVIANPTTIVGNLTVENGGSLVINFGNSLNVSGCLNINGSVQVQLSESDLESLKNNPRTLTILSSACASGTGLSNVIVNSPVLGCRKLLVSRTDDPGSSATSYNAVFSLDSSGCPSSKSKTWWIVLASVLGGIILIVLILALLFTLTPLKGVVRPFSKRSAVETA